MAPRSISVAALAAALLLPACKTSDPPPSPPPALQLSAAALAFDAVEGQGGPAARTVTVTNAGGGTLATPSASVAYAEGSGWLTAAVTGAAAPFTLTVTPAVGGLGAGSYHATVQVASAGASGSPQALAVTLTVAPQPAIDLSAIPYAFVAREGQPASGALSRSVRSTNATPLGAPTVSVAYGPSGHGWLLPSISGAGEPYQLQVAVATQGLAPGIYTADLEVASAGAANSPVVIPVRLDVGPAGIFLQPSALAFTAVAGGAAPPARQVMAAPLGRVVTFFAAVTHQDGGRWLSASLARDGDALRLTVVADPAGLPAGAYAGNIQLSGQELPTVDLPVALTVNAAGADRQVTVTTIGTLWSEAAGSSAALADTDTVTLLQAGPGGAVAEVPATPDGAGHWTASLPPGPYAVRTTSPGGRPALYEVASGANDVDLGFDAVGLSQDRLSTLATSVTIDLAGLAPWAATDLIQVFDQDADLWWTSDLGGTVAAGEGQVAGSFAFDWTPSGPALAAATDTIWVTQLTAVPAPLPCHRVATWQALPGVAMVDGVATTLAATQLAPAVLGAEVAVDLRAQAFAAALAEAGTSSTGSVRVMSQAVPLTVAAQTIDLLHLDTTGAADVDLGPLPYRRFLPRSWPETLLAVRAARVERAHPGGAVARLSVSVNRLDPVEVAPAVVEPVVGAVPAVRVGGVDVTAAAASGVGLTPTVEWDAPAVGAPDGYRLALLELVPGTTSATTRRVASATVTSRTLALPAGWLEAGKTYLLRVEAVADPALVGGASPVRVSARRASATALTQPFGP